MMRKGLGKGKGSGYYNLRQTMAYDKKVHRDAGLGRKQPQRMPQMFGGKYAEKDHKTFQLPNGMKVIAHFEKTRNGFRHIARLYDARGFEIKQAKATYLNRTWESFEYETAIRKVLEGELPKDQTEKYMALMQGKSQEEVDRKFGSIASIAKLGEVFGQTEKEKNDWKGRTAKNTKSGY